MNVLSLTNLSCSQPARNDGSDIKSANTDHASLTAESIAEDLPVRSVSEENTTIHEDDTTVNDDSGNDSRDTLPRKRTRKDHDSGRHCHEKKS